MTGMTFPRVSSGASSGIVLAQVPGVRGSVTLADDPPPTRLQPTAPSPGRPGSGRTCDTRDFTPDLEGIVGAQQCTRELGLRLPAPDRRAASMYGRELNILDRLLDQASRGDESAHRAVVAAFERHLAGSKPLDAGEANRFTDYRSRLETYVADSIWRGNNRYFTGQNAEPAFNEAVGRVLASREPNAAVLGTANTLSYLANAPESLLRSFGTSPQLVPWLAALQASPGHDTPAVRGAWDHMQTSVAGSRAFRSTYTAVLEALPNLQREAFSAGVMRELERSVRDASRPSGAQASQGQVDRYVADLRSRIAFVRANP